MSTHTKGAASGSENGRSPARQRLAFLPERPASGGWPTRQADLEIVDLSAEDAGEAFLLQEVDAAVTWEPWLTQGRATEHGHLLTDSSERPGLIVDGLLTRADVFADRKDDFRAVARAWDAAIGYFEAQPEEATRIMARHVGGWLEDSAVFAETLRGVRFFDAESNRAYFGTPEQPGQIYQTAHTRLTCGPA